MRMRRKKWAEDELHQCEFYEEWPENNLKFKEKFNQDNKPIFMELGCGKGNFISKLASSNLKINYYAVDMIEAMLGLSKRNIEHEYSKLQINKDVEVKFDIQNQKYIYSKKIQVPNLQLVRENCEYINKIFNEQDNIDRLYINFCNPWPKDKHKKRRLTHPRQLEQYKKFLKPGGELFFKTDDNDLFIDSVGYLEESGYKIQTKTFDLHNNDIFANWQNGHINIVTEHEEMFTKEGIKIKALIATI